VAAFAESRKPRMSGYQDIQVAGGDTATPLSLQKRLNRLLAALPDNARDFLDCGCGRGEYVRVLRDRYHLNACGVEFMADKVADAHRVPGLAPFVQQGDLEKLDLPDRSFDGALLNEVLEHIPNEAAALREIHRVLRPGGRLIVFSPNRWYPFESHGADLRWPRCGLPHWVPFIPWLPLALSQRLFSFWARNYWPHELAAMLRAAGFRVIGTDFLWQTFEGISGRQPALIRVLRPAFRAAAALGEMTPGLRRFGVSQVLIAERPAI
jgi:SAM-dependent methyltransferase